MHKNLILLITLNFKSRLSLTVKTCLLDIGSCHFLYCHYLYCSNQVFSFSVSNQVKSKIFLFLLWSPIAWHSLACTFFAIVIVICTFFTSPFFTFFYISRRKYWFRTNFRFPVVDGNVCVSVCLSVWQNFCGKCSSRTNEQNFMKLYI